MKKTLRKSLTKALVEGLKPDPAGKYIVWDTTLRGFHVNVAPDGARKYYVYYRTRDGLQRRPLLGEHGAGGVTAEKARAKAKDFLSEAALGGDPTASRAEAKAMPTLKKFFEETFLPDQKRRTKGRTYYENELRWRKHIEPALGTRRLDKITVADIRGLHNKMAAGPIGANRTLMLLKVAFNRAKDWGVLPAGFENPATSNKVKPYPEKAQERYLEPEELKSLWVALDAAEAAGKEIPYAVHAIRLMIVTGARRGEILNLTWGAYDEAAGALRLADSKTGKKTIWLNALAVQIMDKLKPLRMEGNPYIIAGHNRGRLVGFHRIWDRIRTAAGLADLRAHDVRHSFASFGAGKGGLGLAVVGSLLGHMDTRTTKRYSHIAEAVAQEAVERIGDVISEALAGGGARVVDISPAAESQKEESAK